MQECQIAELSDGRVMMNMRAGHLNKSCDCRSFSLSDDGGATWGPLHYDPELIEPVCSAGLINLEGNLYFSNPADKTARDKMTVRRSTNSGQSWDASLLIWAGPAAYRYFSIFVSSQKRVP